PENGSDTGRQDAGPDRVALSGFPRDGVAQRDPLVVDGAHAVDREIQFAGSAEPAFFVGLRDHAGYPGAFGDQYGIADADGISYREFNGLTFLRRGRRNILVQAHTNLGPFG